MTSAGTIIGIVLGSVVIVLSLGYLVWKYAWLPNKNRKTRMPVPEEDAINRRIKKNASYATYPTVQEEAELAKDDQRDTLELPSFVQMEENSSYVV